MAGVLLSSGALSRYRASSNTMPGCSRLLRWRSWHESAQQTSTQFIREPMASKCKPVSINTELFTFQCRQMHSYINGASAELLDHLVGFPLSVPRRAKARFIFVGHVLRITYLSVLKIAINDRMLIMPACCKTRLKQKTRKVV